MSARILPFQPTADLIEALDTVDLLDEALTQAIGNRKPTGLQLAALAVVDGLRAKHRRSPSRGRGPNAA